MHIIEKHHSQICASLKTPLIKLHSTGSESAHLQRMKPGLPLFFRGIAAMLLRRQLRRAVPPATGAKVPRRLLRRGHAPDMLMHLK